jgi:hypothetical protein
MAEAVNQSEIENVTASGEIKPHSINVGVRLVSGEPSSQPVLCNFSGVKAANGLLVAEFGFLEPEGLNALTRAVRAGANPPDTIGGQRICRVALPIDTAAQLAQQLNQFLSSIAAAQAKSQQ